MKNRMLKLISVILSVLIVLFVVPVSHLSEVCKRSVYPQAEAASYDIGDVISFGSYPQTEERNESITAELNARASKGEWISYGYYSGEGTGLLDENTGEVNDGYGTMAPGNLMEYCDITLSGVKYRGVRINRFRPQYTNYSAETDQSSDGIAGGPYWYRWEPVEWCVIDPDKGLVLCKSTIDSQPFSNTVYEIGDAFFNNNDPDPTNRRFINDYETSSIRKWLNNDFYNCAFSSAEQKCIGTTELAIEPDSDGDSQPGSTSVEDKIFLLSYDEYQAISKNIKLNRGRRTAYATCQGLKVINSTYESAYGHWWLRTADQSSNYEMIIKPLGTLSSAYAYDTSIGVRPAFQFKSVISGNLMAGKCGENISWTLDIHGILSIEGNGEMYDFTPETSPFAHRRDIFEVYNEGDGLQSIGENAFYKCSNLQNVTIGKGVAEIEYNAFFGCPDLSYVYYRGSVTNWYKDLLIEQGNDDFGSADVEFGDTTPVYPKGYQFPRDSYRFVNKPKLFNVNDNMFKTMYYPAHSDSFDQFYDDQKSVANNGVCFGMVYTSAAILKGYPHVWDIKTSYWYDPRKSLNDVSKDDRFWLNNKYISMEDYILYAQIYQNSTEHLGAFNAGVYNASDGYDMHDDLQHFCRYIQSSILNDSYVHILIRYFPNPEQEEHESHSVLAVGLKGNNILVYDPNSPGNLQEIKIVNTFTGWSFSNPWRANVEMNEKNCILIAHGDDLVKPYEILATGEKAGYSVDDEEGTGSSITGADRLDGDKLLLYANDTSFRMDAEKSLRIDDMSSSDNLSETDGRRESLYWICKDKTVRISDVAADDSVFSLAGRTKIVKAHVCTGDQIEFTVDEDNNNVNAVIDGIKGQTYTLEVKTCTESEKDGFIISGSSGKKTITVAQTEGGLIADGFKDMTVSYFANEEQTYSVSNMAENDGPVLIFVDKTRGSITIRPAGSNETAVSSSPGDVNGDGRVNANDARLALRASAKLEVLTQEQALAADVDGNGHVYANDARQILRFAAKLQNLFDKKNEVVRHV